MTSKNEIYYNEILKQNNDYTKAFEGVIDVAIQLGGIEQGSDYHPENDPVVKCIETLGQTMLSADGHVSEQELKCLSKFTAIAHSKAAKLHQRIQSATDGDAIDDENINEVPK